MVMYYTTLFPRPKSRFHGGISNFLLEKCVKGVMEVGHTSIIMILFLINYGLERIIGDQKLQVLHDP
jgi:hypothetical protein